MFSRVEWRDEEEEEGWVGRGIRREKKSLGCLMVIWVAGLWDYEVHGCMVRWLYGDMSSWLCFSFALWYYVVLSVESSSD